MTRPWLFASLFWTFIASLYAVQIKVLDLLGADAAEAVGSAVEAETEGRRETILIKDGARVNVTRVVEIESHAAGDATAILAGGTRVRVSRTFRASLLGSLSK